MSEIKMEDVKDTALKLDRILKHSPEEYFYIKGWIHCLSQKKNVEQAEQKTSKRIG